MILLPGLMFLLSAPLVPDIPEADRKRRAALSRELAAYSTPAQRRDLEATFDQYPDNVTYELRDILASQATVHCSNGIPGTPRAVPETWIGRALLDRVPSGHACSTGGRPVASARGPP